jgi:hypothetical protein
VSDVIESRSKPFPKSFRAHVSPTEITCSLAVPDISCPRQSGGVDHHLVAIGTAKKLQPRQLILRLSEETSVAQHLTVLLVNPGGGLS